MESQKAVFDQRENDRSSVKDWIFAIIDPYSSGMVKILDVSRGGLAFHYVARPNEILLTKFPNFHIHIFDARDGNCLVKLPCKAVYDVEPAQECHEEPFKIRRCGVRFEKLLGFQTKQLKGFMRKYTIREIPPGIGVRPLSIRLERLFH